MDVITIESAAFKEIIRKVDAIHDFVLKQNNNEELNDEWVDNYEVCTFLKISTRTLQRLRNDNLITYSIIRGKIYYQLKEVKRMLSEHLIRRDDGCFNDLVVKINQRRLSKK